MHALRAGRLTALVGAVGIDKTTLLVSRVLPLLHRGTGELLHFVAQWNQAPLDSLLRALAALPAAAQARFDLADAMSPMHLSALSQRHGGARLLFVFDHFELLLQDAMHNAALQRFVDAWPAVVQAPDLNAHFLVAVDEPAWIWLQTLYASTTPQVELRAFRLETRSGRQVLESLTLDPPDNSTAKSGVKPADFADLLSESLARASKVAREASRQGAEAAGSGSDTRARRITEVAASAAQAQRDAQAARQAEAAGVVDAHGLAQALAAAEATVAREVQARKVAEAATKAAQAELRAAAERNAEAAGQAEAARQVEVQRLAQALAAAEATVAREVQARKIAEAAAKAAQAELRAEAERNAEAARQRARQQAPEELAIAAAAMSPPAPGGTDSAPGRLRPAVATAGPARTVLVLGAALLAAAVAAVLWWPTRPTAPAAPVASLPVATAPALPRTADSASAAAPALASAAAPVAAVAAEPASVGGSRYEVLATTADRPRAGIARELAAALSSEANGLRVVPVADGTDPIAWLRAPDRMAIARLDALRAAGGSGAPPLRVLTPLFSESVLFIVRADSPLKYFHQLRGKRLSIGPDAGPESHTVRETYRRLFGAEMSKPAQSNTDQALAELVALRSIDAVAIVMPRSSAWRASLDPKIAKRLRLLTLDPRHPADRKLLQTLGTQVTRIGAGSKKGTRTTTTPTVMSYLVVSGTGDADVDRLTAMVRALCRELPRLRKQGDPVWRELKPSAPFDTGWPVVRPFQSALSKCARR